MRRVHLHVAASIAVLAAAGTSVTARADIAPTPEPGTKFVDYAIEIVGLTEQAGMVIVGWDDPSNGEITGHAVFAPGDASHVVAHGRRRHNLGAPRLFAMTKGDYAAWAAETSKTVEAERTACFERHEGCVHESRFVAHYAPPKNAIDCGTRVEAVTSVPLDGPDHVVGRWSVVEIGPKVCRLAAAPPPAPTPTPVEPLPAPATSAPPASKGCGAGGGDAASALALAFVVARRLGRRKTDQGGGIART